MKVEGVVRKTPIVFSHRTRDRNFLIEGRQNIYLHRRRKAGWKTLSPDSDILPMVVELLGVRVAGRSLFQDRVQSISISGILRALMIVKRKYPDVYQEIKLLAQLLSYNFDKNLAVPPLYLLRDVNSEALESIWQKLQNKSTVTKEEYMRIVVEEFQEKGLDKLFALFYADENEDEDEMIAVLTSEDQDQPHPETQAQGSPIIRGVVMDMDEE